MKLKIYKGYIITLNSSLKDVEFNEEIEVRFGNWNFIGRESSNETFEEVKLIYRPVNINKLKYIYEINKMSLGSVFEHLGFAKVTLLQHIYFSFVNHFIKFIFNFENIFKIFTILCLLIPLFCNRKENITKIYVIKNDKSEVDSLKFK